MKILKELYTYRLYIKISSSRAFTSKLLNINMIHFVKKGNKASWDIASTTRITSCNWDRYFERNYELHHHCLSDWESYIVINYNLANMDLITISLSMAMSALTEYRFNCCPKGLATIWELLLIFVPQKYLEASTAYHLFLSTNYAFILPFHCSSSGLWEEGCTVQFYWIF